MPAQSSVGWAKRSVPTQPCAPHKASTALSKCSIRIVCSASPIFRQIAAPDVSMKRRMRPILRLPHQPMLDRIEMHIIDMPLQINIVANLVFPETPLPDSLLALRNFAGRESFARRQRTGEQAFDQTPAPAEIRITVRQPPYRVQVVRQHAHRHHLKGTPRPNRLKRCAQAVNVFDEKTAAPVCQIDREEIRATGKKAATITGHAETVARMR
jgi:hypothetical protein